MGVPAVKGEPVIAVSAPLVLLTEKAATPPAWSAAYTKVPVEFDAIETGPSPVSIAVPAPLTLPLVLSTV